MVTWCQGQKQQSTEESPQCGEDQNRIADVVPKPQLEILEKTNRGENTGVMAVQ